MTLFLFRRSRATNEASSEGLDVGKVFFDSFSTRVSVVEQEVRKAVRDLEDLRASRDRFQLSDLVLLERLQRAEEMLGESLGWIKKVANAVDSLAETRLELTDKMPADVKSVHASAAPASESLQNFVMPGGEAGSLSSITTPTELQVLAFLSEQGARSAPEIGRVIGRSREHSARLMKKLFEEGYVRRDQTRIPFRYSVVERIRASFKPSEKKEDAKQEAAAVQA